MCDVHSEAIMLSSRRRRKKITNVGGPKLDNGKSEEILARSHDCGRSSTRLANFVSHGQILEHDYNEMMRPCVIGPFKNLA